MWLEKIRRGVLQVSTDTGPRYVNPSLMERVRLVWMFRNFNILNPEVMTQQERALVNSLCADERMKRNRAARRAEQLCVIGTVEKIPPMPPRKAPASVLRSNARSSA